MELNNKSTNAEIVEKLSKFSDKVIILQKIMSYFFMSLSLITFLFQYASPASRIAWGMEEQKRAFQQLSKYLSDPSRDQCTLIVLQNLKILT